MNIHLLRLANKKYDKTSATYTHLSYSFII